MKAWKTCNHQKIVILEEELKEDYQEIQEEEDRDSKITMSKPTVLKSIQMFAEREEEDQLDKETKKMLKLAIEEQQGIDKPSMRSLKVVLHTKMIQNSQRKTFLRLKSWKSSKNLVTTQKRRKMYSKTRTRSLKN